MNDKGYKCPKCGYSNKPDSSECLQCGIIFEKYIQNLGKKREQFEPLLQQAIDALNDEKVENADRILKSLKTKYPEFSEEINILLAKTQTRIFQETSDKWIMNTNQKIILITMVLVISGMFLYPPFNLIAKNGTVLNMGYAWIFEPPRRGYLVANVNTAMLLIQWIGVIVVGGLIFVLAKSPSKSSESSSNGYSQTIEHHNTKEKLVTTTSKNSFSLASFLFSFDGRIGRRSFWCSFPFILVFSIIVSSMMELLVESSNGIVLILFFCILVLLLWVSLAIQAKRWHDRNKSATWLLLNFVPIIGFFWVWIELGFLQGTTGNNDYGIDPLSDLRPTLKKTDLNHGKDQKIPSVHQPKHQLQLSQKEKLKKASVISKNINSSEKLKPKSPNCPLSNCAGTIGSDGSCLSCGHKWDKEEIKECYYCNNSFQRKDGYLHPSGAFVCRNCEKSIVQPDGKTDSTYRNALYGCVVLFGIFFLFVFIILLF